jgi:hypothetical protein
MTRTRRFATTAALATVVLPAATSSSAAAAPPPTLRDVVRQLVKAGSPGAVAVVRTPATSVSATAGLARLEPPAPVRASEMVNVSDVRPSWAAIRAAAARAFCSA